MGILKRGEIHQSFPDELDDPSIMTALAFLIYAVLYAIKNFFKRTFKK